MTSGKITKIVCGGREFPIQKNQEINKKTRYVDDVMGCVGEIGTIIVIDDNGKHVEIKSKIISSRFLTEAEIYSYPED